MGEPSVLHARLGEFIICLIGLLIILSLHSSFRKPAPKSFRKFSSRLKSAITKTTENSRFVNGWINSFVRIKTDRYLTLILVFVLAFSYLYDAFQNFAFTQFRLPQEYYGSPAAIKNTWVIAAHTTVLYFVANSYLGYQGWHGTTDKDPVQVAHSNKPVLTPALVAVIIGADFAAYNIPFFDLLFHSITIAILLEYRLFLALIGCGCWSRLAQEQS